MKKSSDLFAQAGLENISDEAKAEILAKVGQLAQRRILLRVTEEMDTKQREDFEKFLDEKGDKPDEVEDYLRKNIPHIDKLVEDEIEKTREEIFGQMKELGL